MAHKQEQEEEREVLQSIYENEDHFKQHSETVFTFRIGEPGDVKSYSVEIRWGEGYPDEPPTVSLDSIYNSRLTLESKRAIVSALLTEAQSLLGSPMTYSLFEYAKEQAIGLVELETVESAEGTTGDQDGAMKQQKEKKEVLSKQAKRRLADRTNAQGELRRGWNWMDIIRHVTQQN
eukprot:Em0015g611a